MDKKPLVSVLMGIYNCSSTLEEAVQCIINQTYDNWELIMCDDGSVDNTYSVAESICKRDSRIKLIKNDKNMGLSFTLNHCLQYAKGEYTARMDGDDVCDFNRFQKEVDFLNNHSEYALVSSYMNLYDDNGIYGTIKYREKPLPVHLSNSSQFCHAGCMMRKSVLEELNGYSTDSSALRVEDFDLWIRLYKLGYRGYNIQEPLYSMRDDRFAYNRRKFKYRINEFKVCKRACKYFNSPIKYRLKCFKPLIVGLLPQFIYKYLHKKRFA